VARMGAQRCDNPPCRPDTDHLVRPGCQDSGVSKTLQADQKDLTSRRLRGGRDLSGKPTSAS
jgi:hypothetical protein